MPKDKVIVVSFASPYVMNEYFERVATCINAYSEDPEMHRAVVGVLIGKLKANGITPVNVENNAFKKYITVDGFQDRKYLKPTLYMVYKKSHPWILVQDYLQTVQPIFGRVSILSVNPELY